MHRDSVRRVPLWLIVAAVLCLAARLGAEAYEKKHPPQWADLVQWKTPEQAAEILTMEQRPTLYDFTASWCEACGQMRQEVFADEGGAASTNQFLAVRVDEAEAKHSHAAAELQQRFLVDSMPTLVITGPKLPLPLVQRGYPGREQTKQFIKDGFIKATMGPSFGSGL